MSHQRFPSHDPIKEPHSVSVKVLRLSRPSLVPQYPTASPAQPPTATASSLAASLAYQTPHDTNPDPFPLSPILALPASFGSAYVGETFSCTLCANNDLAPPSGPAIRHVRIHAEMKTPGAGGAAQKMSLVNPDEEGVDLAPGATLQRLVSFALKEEGNHVLAVTVSYYEATETSGRTRTFRKLYQFICKAGLVVRTKVGVLGPAGGARPGAGGGRWVLEAQLENSSDDTVQLDRVDMEVPDGLSCQDCNWEARAGGDTGVQKPILHPGEVEQVCFVLSRDEHGEDDAAAAAEGRIALGALGIAWRGSMGNRGFISTGQLGTRLV
ncbi:hypothetical protein E4U42_001891 [Claviceps africana]|uniref:Trafficking protein particle complex subunit 13 n=1 Tax=Claviceps africana TaxID=83212 RepID=A0A8K0JBP0_9HYPO|nr:hypothetical protein E4U42_001891 [Claviceps africana]